MPCITALLVARCAVQVTQMKYRLSEGSGECFYYIGAPAADVLVYSVLETVPLALASRCVLQQ